MAADLIEGAKVCWEISFYTPDREKNYAYGIVKGVNETHTMALVQTGDGKETWMPVHKLEAAT